MKNQWPLWLIIIAIVVVLLVAFNHNRRQIASINDIFSEEGIEEMPEIDFEYVDDASQQTGKGEEGFSAPQTSLAKQKESIKPVATVASQPVAGASKAGDPSALSRTKVAQTTKPAPVPMEADVTKATYTIQVVSSRDKVRAEVELKKIKASGYPAYLIRKDLGQKGVWYRIYVGKFADKSEANQLLSKLKTAYKDCFIIKP